MLNWIFSKKYLRCFLILLAVYGYFMLVYFESHFAIKTNISSVLLGSNENDHSGGKKTDYLSNGLETECPVNQLPMSKLQLKTAETSSKEIRCKQHIPSKAACAFVKDFYAYNFEEWMCGNTESLEICIFQDNSQTLECDHTKCKSKNEVVFIHLFDAKHGRVKRLRHGFKNNDILTENVKKFAAATLSKGFPFIFLSCGSKNPKDTQLLVLDPAILNAKLNQHKKNENKINLNIIFLDSISRAHFYRSLTKTIDYFATLNRKSDNVEVLDFQLVQAIHGHTTENILGLMTGKIFPNTTTDKDKESAKTNFPKMLKFVKDHGYETLYQEDECWKGFWGLNSDLGTFTKWEEFYNELKANSYIDDTGLTFSACKIIDTYDSDLNHVFNTDEKICYNGLNFDTYYMNYLIKKIINAKSPLFSFTTLNIAHDPTGKRVQGIDEDLMSFFDFARGSRNTLTILFSDHGNTYNDFVYTDIEGRYEMFHPSLFMLIPDGVRKKLGHEFINNLRKNQNRLINLVDIHHTIKHIVDRNHPNKGILQEISPDRTCGDIPMSMPNLCVCDGWDSPIENTTELMPYVEYAIGQINNVISNASPSMKCKRLVPTSFQNVMQRKTGDSAILSFDILTSPGHGSKNEEERISVEVSHQVSDKMDHFNTKLISYDRVSRFGDYRVCSDANTKFRYCVCDMKTAQVTNKLTTFENLSPVRNRFVFEMLNTEESIDIVIPNKVGILIRKTKDNDKNLVTVTFETLSYAGFSGSYEIKVVFKDLENLKPLNKKPCIGVIKANSMVYLCTLARKWSIWAADFSYDIKHRKI